MDTITTFAPAKLNLFLELHRRREDGFHELETVMLAIDRCDRITVRRRPVGPVRVTSRWSPSKAVWQAQLGIDDDAILEIPDGPGNLAYQAAECLRTALGITAGFDIEIEKNIPAGAGMGGASSDAASVLRAVAQLGGQPIAARQLQRIAAELGSDVPFFLGVCDDEASPEHASAEHASCKLAEQSCAALATGRGEQLHSVRCTGDVRFVVAFPPHPLSTGKVYSVCQVPEQPVSPAALLKCLANGDLSALPQHLFNRLATAASQLSPWVDRLLETMRRTGLQGCQLTGSGAACFGIATSASHAETCVADLKRAGFGVSFAASPLPVPTPLQ